MCVACMLNKQEKAIRSFADEAKKSEYIRQVLEQYESVFMREERMHIGQKYAESNVECK